MVIPFIEPLGCPVLRCPLHDLCWYVCFQGSVQAILDRKNEMDNQAHICEQLGKANTFFVEFYNSFSHHNFKSNETENGY